MDINPGNMMYSPTFEKLVFIDFGFSETIELEPGYKASTTFKGTPEYASKQWLALFSVEEKHGYVDLYYNDLVGLQKSFEEFEVKFSEE